MRFRNVGMFLHMPTFSNTREDQSQARMLSTLPRPPEHPVALFHELPVRPQRRVARQQEARVLESLQAVLQHRAVWLAENVRAQLHRQVRPHAQDVPVERRVVQLAQRQPVRHDRLAPRMPVRQDVRRVEQLLVPQPADGALLAVRPQHPLPELLLVHALLAEARHVRTPYGVFRPSSPISSRKMVPPSASWNRPGRSRSAPVNAPQIWPKNSLSNMSLGMALQFTRINGPPDRRPLSWISRAISSLPVPDSPTIRTV